MEVKIDIGGIKVYVKDKEGIREKDSVVEKIGIESESERMEEEDMVIQMEDMRGNVYVKVEKIEEEKWMIGKKEEIGGSDQGLWKYKI